MSITAQTQLIGPANPRVNAVMRQLDSAFLVISRIKTVCAEELLTMRSKHDEMSSGSLVYSEEARGSDCFALTAETSENRWHHMCLRCCCKSSEVRVASAPPPRLPRTEAVEERASGDP